MIFQELMKKNKSIEKKIIKILKDLFHLVKYDLDELENMEKDYWHYDRPMFLRKNAGDKIDKKYSYDIDLETLKTMVFQIGLFSKIITTDEDGEKIIKELVKLI